MVGSHLFDAFSNAFSFAFLDKKFEVTLRVDKKGQGTYWILDYSSAVNLVTDLETQIDKNKFIERPHFKMPPPIMGDVTNLYCPCEFMTLLKEKLKDFIVKEEANAFFP
jgi:hypothetical protein